MFSEIVLTAQVYCLSARSTAFEELDRALVPLGLFSRLERAEVLAIPSLRILFSRVETVLAGAQLSNHVPRVLSPMDEGCTISAGPACLTLSDGSPAI
jgi:hypothetical protein